MLFLNTLILKVSLLTFLKNHYHRNIFTRFVGIWAFQIPRALNRMRILFSSICYVYFVFTNTILQQIILLPTMLVCLYNFCIRIYIIVLVMFWICSLVCLSPYFLQSLISSICFLLFFFAFKSFEMSVVNHLHSSICIIVHALFMLLIHSFT